MPHFLCLLSVYHIRNINYYTEILYIRFTSLLSADHTVSKIILFMDSQYRYWLYGGYRWRRKIKFRFKLTKTFIVLLVEFIQYILNITLINTYILYINIKVHSLYLYNLIK